MANIFGIFRHFHVNLFLLQQICETLKGYNQVLERVAHLMPPDVHRLLEKEAQRVNSTILINRRAYADLTSNLLSGKYCHYQYYM